MPVYFREKKDRDGVTTFETTDTYWTDRES